MNLLKESDDIDLRYDFKFLTDEEVKKANGEFYWFEVGRILDIKEYPVVMNFLVESGLTNTSKFTNQQVRSSMNTMNELYNVIHQKGLINFYLEKSDDLDNVLQIFIRTNSGETKLNYFDLLLSVANAQWKDKDAREVIHEFVDDINHIDQGFTFDKDFVLKACLVLGDFNDVKFKVDNFTRDNMLKIESLWDNITQAISTTIKLVSNYGFNRDTLTSANALILIAYCFTWRQEFLS